MTAERKTYSLRGPSINGEIDDLLKDRSDVEGRQRLQALISEWLRMENLVVLTGAGCSIACGGKSMHGANGIEKAVLEAVNAIATLSRGAKRIIAGRLKPMSERKDWAQTGFEEWLSYLVNAVYLGSEARSPIRSLTWKEQNDEDQVENTAISIADVELLIGYIGLPLISRTHR